MADALRIFRADKFTFPQHIQHINVVFEFPTLNMEISAEKQILKDNGTLLFEIFSKPLRIMRVLWYLFHNPNGI